MENKDTHTTLHIVGAGRKPDSAAEPLIKFTVPKGAIWAVLIARADGGLVFSIETEGAHNAQIKTLLEGTLLAHKEVMHQYLDNGWPSVNDMISPEMRAKVAEDEVYEDD